MGIDVLGHGSPEVDILNLDNAIVQGNLPKGPNQILVSEAFAEKLDISIGETATLIGSTMNGSMSMHNFKVAGTIRFGMLVLDRSTVIADINDIRVAMDMMDGASEIVGFTKDMVYSDSAMHKVAEKFNRNLSDEEDEFSPIMLRLGEQGGLVGMLDMANAVGGIVVLVFVLVMSIVLWNAGLMNGIRRYGEVGVRLAMGEAKGSLYRSMIFESLCVGIAGSVLGTILGLAISYWMQYVGIDAGNMLQKSAVIMSTVYRAKVTPTSYYIGFFPGLLASVIGTMFAGIGIYRRKTSQLFRELEV
jgi:putative ABC transport system permease protein